MSRRVLIAVGAVVLALGLYFGWSLFSAHKQVGTQLTLGLEDLQGRRWQEALDKLQQVLRVKPKDPKAVSGAALAHYELGNWKDSMDMTQRVLEIDPNNEEAQVRIASCLFQLGNVDKSRLEYEKILQSFPNSFGSRVGLGNCILHQALLGDEKDKAELLKKSRDEINKALTAKPNSPEGLLILARLQFIANEVAEASASLGQVLAQDRESAIAADLLGQVALKQKDYLYAETLFKQASKARKRTASSLAARIRDHIGLACYYQDKLAEALDQWTQATRADPLYHLAFFHFGVLNQLRGMTKEARGSYRRAGELLNISGASTEKTNEPFTVEDQIQILKRLANLNLARSQYNEALKPLEDLTILAPDSAFVLFELGNAQYMRGRRDEAIRAYEQALRLSPNDTRTAYNLGTVYLEQGAYAKAEEAFKLVVSLDPNNMDARLNLGDTYLNSRSIQEAVTQYQSASEATKDDSLPHIRLGLALEQSGNLADAQAAYQKAQLVSPSDARGFFYEGMILRRLGGPTNLTKAEENLTKAIQLDPQNDTARTELGFVLLKSAKFSEAQEQFKVVLENPIFPSYDKAYNGMGNVFLAQGDLPKAEECFQKVKERRKAGQIEIAEVNLGNLSFKQNDYSKAREHYEAALLLNSRFPVGSYNLSCAYAMEENWSRAAVELQNCLQEDPQFSKAWYNLGVAFEKTGKPDRALESYAKEAGESALKAKLNLIRLFTDQGDMKSAEAVFAEAEKLGEPTAGALSVGANLSLRLGRSDEAISRARLGLQKLALEDKNMQTKVELQLHAVLSCALSYSGDWNGAVQEFLFLLNANTEDQAVRLNLGLAYASLGQAKEAEEAYQQVLNALPSDPRPYRYLGNLKLGNGEYPQAREFLGKSFALDPTQQDVKQVLDEIRDL